MYKTHGKEYGASHYITYDDLYSVVFADIQRVIRSYNYDPDRFRQLLDKRCSSSADKKIAALTAECEQKTTRIAEIDKIIVHHKEADSVGREYL